MLGRYAIEEIIRISPRRGARLAVGMTKPDVNPRCKKIDEKVQKHDEQKEEEESQLWASTGTA